MNNYTVIPRFTSLIHSSKTAHKVKTHKTKLIYYYFPKGTMISLWEEGTRISENWLVNWKTGINLCISYEQKLVNQLLVYWGITVLTSSLTITFTINFCFEIKEFLVFCCFCPCNKSVSEVTYHNLQETQMFFEGLPWVPSINISNRRFHYDLHSKTDFPNKLKALKCGSTPKKSFISQTYQD
jgi:hypothetical protein